MSQRSFGLTAAFWVGFMAGLGSFWEYDTWWHLAGGRLLTEIGTIPHVDVFSFTAAGREWIMHEWAWDLLLYSVYSWLGPAGATALKALVSGLIAMAMLHLARRRGAGTLVALAAVCLGLVAVEPWLNHRPQILQPLFLLIALHFIQDAREGKLRGLLAYPALMFVWVNCHGSFPLGLVLLGLYALCQMLGTEGGGLRASLPRLQFRALPVLALVFIVSAAVCFLGPNGVRGALYPLDYFDGSMSWATSTVTEWKSPNWHSEYMQPLGIIILLLVAALAFSPTSPALFEVLLVLMGLRMALTWGRSAPILVVFAVPLIAAHVTYWLDAVAVRGRGLERELDRLFRPELPVRRAVAWGLCAVLCIGGICMVPWDNDLSKLSLWQYPVKAAEVMEVNRLRGNMINVYHWGGYLLWRFYNQRRVFMDGRADVYGKAIWEKYRAVSNAYPNWKDVLDEFDVQIVLMDSRWTICRLLDASPEFCRVYSDSKASLYVRRDGPNARVVTDYEAGRLVIPRDSLPNRAALLGQSQPPMTRGVLGAAVPRAGS